MYTHMGTSFRHVHTLYNTLYRIMPNYYENLQVLKCVYIFHCGFNMHVHLA